MRNIATKIYAANVTPLKDGALYNAAYYMATEERRKKTDGFRFERDRRLSVGAELLLMKGLEEWGINPKEIKYYYGKNGKPCLAGKQDIYFNISHSGEAVICAVSLFEVGCDIEKVSDVNLKIAERFFCEDEYEMIMSQKTEELKREMFFRLWTLKESFIKLTGMGIGMPMKSFSIKPDKDKIIVKQEHAFNACYFQELFLWKNYKCSVCGFDSSIGIKSGVSFEILNFCDMLK